MSELSLYDRLGGGDAVTAAVGLLYDKLLDDAEVAPFFEGVDMAKLVRKQIAFVTIAFGGPHAYTGGDLREAHAAARARGLGGRHFDAVKRYLHAALVELGVPEGLADEAGRCVEGTRGAVLGT